MSAASLIAQGYYGYSGWSDTEADANFADTGGAGKGGPTTTDSSTEGVINTISSSLDDLYAEEIKLADELFGEDNAFSFDEYLARESATEEYKPYYSELLQDYTTDIEAKKETVQDKQRLLGEFEKMDIGESTRAYTRAVSRAGEGFAGEGMFFSGLKKRKLGEAEVEQRESERRLTEEYGYKGRELGREEEALDVGLGRKERDIFGTGRQFETAVEGGVEQRRGEQLKEYYTPRLQTYFRRFPSSEYPLRGYDIPEGLRY